MTVLALASQKGGVGKTTLALNLSYAFARRGWKTLLVDTDPQGGIGLSLGGRVRTSDGLAQALHGVAELKDLFLPTRLPELVLLPFGHSSALATAGLAASLQDGIKLRTLFRECSEHFDLIAVDSPAGLGGTTVGVLRASSHLVVPLQAEPLALRSLERLLELVGEIREETVGLDVAGVVPTMVQSRQEVSLATTQEAYRLLPGEVLLDAFVPRDRVFLEASAMGVPVGLLRRRPPPVTAVFDQIAAELEPRLGLAGEEQDDEPIPLLD